MAAKDNDERKQDDQDSDGAMLDMSQAAVKRMIGDAKERGYITYDQLNAVLPPEQVSSEQIEDVMSMLSEMGINIIENDEAEEGEDKGGEIVEVSTSREIAVATSGGETLDRTDDPVRMYLREMGSVELLSREGEIAIAKRIEAGRNTMIAGLCESPLTFQAITIWRDELLSEDILLRDVIDLEATFGRSMGEDDEDAPVVDGLDIGAKPARGGDGRRTRARRRRRADPPRGGRGGRRAGEHVARRDGERAQAPRARDARPDRARLREALRDAGPPHVGHAERGRLVLGGARRRSTRSSAPRSCSS
jgi:hypothetical protein